MTKKRIFFETEEVVHKTRRGYIDLDMDYFQFYNAAFHHLASLSNSCARDFIMWVMAHVDSDNRFSYDKELFNSFLQALAGIKVPKKYSEQHMFAALKELVEKEVLFKESKGRYMVNPKLFWSEDTSKRITAIRYIESNSRVENSSSNGTPLIEENYERITESSDPSLPAGIADTVGLVGD